MSLSDSVKMAVDWDTPHINCGDSLFKAISLMVEFNTSALVVKVHGAVAGILCDIDLVHSVINEENLKTTKVGEVMTACDLMTENGAVNPCAQIYEMESVLNALKVIEAAGTHNLLIAGSESQKAGLVSIRNLLKAVIQ